MLTETLALKLITEWGKHNNSGRLYNFMNLKLYLTETNELSDNVGCNVCIIFCTLCKVLKVLRYNLSKQFKVMSFTAWKTLYHNHNIHTNIWNHSDFCLALWSHDHHHYSRQKWIMKMKGNTATWSYLSASLHRLPRPEWLGAARRGRWSSHGGAWP